MLRTNQAAAVLAGLLWTAAAQATPNPAAQTTRADASLGFVLYQTTSHDTLWLLAERYYGDPLLWPRIAKANPTVDPNHLKAGTTLNIPLAPEDMPSAAAQTAAAKAAAAKPPPAPAPAAIAAKPAPTKAAVQAPAPPPPTVNAPSFKAADAVALHQNMPPEEASMLNEELPADMIASQVGMPAHKEPLGWRPQGFVKDTGEVLAAEGDEIQVAWLKAVQLSPGDRVYVVQVGGHTYEPGTRHRTGVLIQTLAELRITQAVSPTLSRGIIEASTSGVEPGASVQLAAP